MVAYNPLFLIMIEKCVNTGFSPEYKGEKAYEEKNVEMCLPSLRSCHAIFGMRLQKDTAGVFVRSCLGR